MNNMEKAITVVGGDLRIVKLVEMLINDGYSYNMWTWFCRIYFNKT